MTAINTSNMEGSAPPRDFNRPVTYDSFWEVTSKLFEDIFGLNRVDRKEFINGIMEDSNSDGSEFQSPMK